MALYTSAIQQLYVAYFSRPADAGGLEWWESVVANARGDISMISAEFAASNEFRQTFAGKSNVEIVRTVYMNLFGREAEDGGIDFWVKALDQRLTTIDTVVTEIARGAQNQDLKAFNNKVSAATAFTSALDTYPERASYQGDEAHAAAKTFLRTVTDDASLAAAIVPDRLAASVAAFVEASRANFEITLTANADSGAAFTGSGGTNVFRATAATLGAGDDLKGGGGLDIIFLNDVNGNGLAALPAGVRISGIETFAASSGAGVGSAGSAYDLSGQTDLTSIHFDAKGAVNARVHDGAKVQIVTTSGGVKVDGGKAITLVGNTGPATLTGNAITSVELIGTSQDVTITNTTAGHTLDLALTNVQGATITDAAATTVNLDATPIFEIGPVIDAMSASILPGIIVALDMAKATTLNIRTHDHLTLGTTALAAADTLETITLKGLGSMWADLSGIQSFRTFDASTYAGDTTLKIASAPNLTVKGGSGVDKLVVAGAPADSGIVFQGHGGRDEVTLYRDAAVADVIRFARASDSFLVFGQGQAEANDGMDTYYYFQSGVDKIDLSGLQLAAGANRAGIATHTLMSNDYQVLREAIGDGLGFFNDGGIKRSLAFADHGGGDGYLMVDVNGDGNYTGGVDMIVHLVGNGSAPKITDILWG
jgi:hypothetical protein